MYTKYKICKILFFCHAVCDLNKSIIHNIDTNHIYNINSYHI